MKPLRYRIQGWTGKAKSDYLWIYGRGHTAGETILQLAQRHEVPRMVVRQAISSGIPPNEKKPAREKPKLGPVNEHIERMLETDRQAPGTAEAHGASDLGAIAQRASRTSNR